MNILRLQNQNNIQPNILQPFAKRCMREPHSDDINSYLKDAPHMLMTIFYFILLSSALSNHSYSIDKIFNEL